MEYIYICMCVCVCVWVCVYVCVGLHPLHMEVPRLGVELELQLMTYTSATAEPDLSHI